MEKNVFIGIAGNIGVGKTTFTRIIAERFDWDPYYESVVDNPYLSDFYHDMHRWAFNLQIYFLHHRFQTHMKMSESVSGVIQDRTIYEDVEIFARNLYELKFLSERDWDTYRQLFKNMTSFLRKPDIIIYLKASTETLLNRIQSRNRDYEKDIDPNYLDSLNTSYNKWVERIDDIQVMTVPTDKFNIFEDDGMLDEICQEIESRLTIGK